MSKLTEKEINKNIEHIMECIEYFKEEEEKLINQKTGDLIVDAFLEYRIKKKIGLFGEADALFLRAKDSELKEWKREVACIEAIAIMWEAMEYDEEYNKNILNIEQEFLIFKAGYKATKDF